MSSTLETILLLSGGSIVHGFANLILILFVLFYLLIDWNHFFKLIEGLIPPRFAHTARHLCHAYRWTAIAIPARTDFGHFGNGHVSIALASAWLEWMVQLP